MRQLKRKTLQSRNMPEKSLNNTLGQKYLPNRVGFSSGVTLGVAVAIGGGAAPIIGKIGDLYGIWYSLASIAFLPVFFSAIVLSLPKSE